MLTNNYDSRQNMIRALNSHQREKLFLVRGSKGFIREMSLELEFSALYKYLLRSAVPPDSVPGTGDSETKPAHLCSWKSSQSSHGRETYKKKSLNPPSQKLFQEKEKPLEHRGLSN